MLRNPPFKKAYRERSETAPGLPPLHGIDLLERDVRAARGRAGPPAAAHGVGVVVRAAAEPERRETAARRAARQRAAEGREHRERQLGSREDGEERRERLAGRGSRPGARRYRGYFSLFETVGGRNPGRKTKP